MITTEPRHTHGRNPEAKEAAISDTLTRAPPKQLPKNNSVGELSAAMEDSVLLEQAAAQQRAQN